MKVWPRHISIMFFISTSGTCWQCHSHARFSTTFLLPYFLFVYFHHIPFTFFYDSTCFQKDFMLAKKKSNLSYLEKKNIFYTTYQYFCFYSWEAKIWFLFPCWCFLLKNLFLLVLLCCFDKFSTVKNKFQRIYNNSNSKNKLKHIKKDFDFHHQSVRKKNYKSMNCEKNRRRVWNSPPTWLLPYIIRKI